MKFTHSELLDEIKKIFNGEVNSDVKTLDTYSRDASLLEVKPELVLFPKDSEDIQKLVKFVSENKADNPSLSITARSAGTCMSGGSLSESIVLDITKHMGGIKEVTHEEAIALPGTFYRDFEVETFKHDAILPSYTASKNLNTVGGMVANNSAGEKTLAYGKTEEYVKEMKVIFADGNEYITKPLNKEELDRKIAQNDYEGNIYKNLWNLIKENEDAIKHAKPDVSKNSAGYYLWNVWDGQTFDINKLITGSQGTLGIITEIKFRLVPIKKKSKLFVIFLKNLNNLSELVNEILTTKPESLESYDDSTMKLAFKFFPAMIKTMKVHNFFKLMFGFLPEAGMILTGGIPKLILLVEFSDNDEGEIDKKMYELQRKIAHFGFKTRMSKSEEESSKYWTIRRESFNLLRQHVKGARTAPFIDDVIVKPQYLPEFLPKMRKILDEHKLVYTIAGHAGNGNFHIIPLMNMKDPKNAAVIPIVSDKIYSLVKEYRGSIDAEHNDGIIRTPYLEQMFGHEIVALFQKTKNIFDPQNIFNPGKKVGGTKEYMISHIVKS
ncbi:MAG: oxygen-dependent FAD-containing oxidoreductase [Parcubacteria bacterium C7867-003]|nr:MAG: oxygen-dependent FAD-containing oxidoreductase [Parcubacteria bacterium C7867-003]